MDKASNNGNSPGSVVSNRTMNLVGAGMLMTVAVIVMVASYRLGSGWAQDVGPDSGYFPFYIGLFLFISSSATFVQNFLKGSANSGGSFIARHQLAMVLQVLIPMTIFVVLSVFIGIYISMMLFIGFFMMWLGKYSIVKTLPVVIGVTVVLFVVFEMWFLVPLPKGPIEAMFGF